MRWLWLIVCFFWGQETCALSASRQRGASVAFINHAEEPTKKLQLPLSYNRFVLPRREDGPGALLVEALILVNKLFEVDVARRTASVELYMELTWRDPILWSLVPANQKWHPVALGQLWTPQIVIDDTVERPTTLSSIIQVSADGSVRQLKRLKVSGEMQSFLNSKGRSGETRRMTRVSRSFDHPVFRAADLNNVSRVRGHRV